MAESAAIMWADSDYENTPEREEAIAAVSDILKMFDLTVGGAVLERAVQRVICTSGVAERRGYDLGWTHCEDSIRE
ncbi:MAG TPA: hypothetical protein VN719_16145 [Gemmatimonadales bacterium]|nr:hypothetical protein [Gemmatimonadales bacterium]